MLETGLDLLRRLSVFSVSFIVATTLIVISIDAATAGTYLAPGSLASRVQHNSHDLGRSIGRGMSGTFESIGHGFASAFRAVGRGVMAVVHLPGNMLHFFAHLLDVRAFIRPADALAVPVITAAPPVPVKLVLPVVVTTPPSTGHVQTAAASIPPAPSVANGYAWGNCTWWVAIRRAQNNDEIPTDWGNAAAWAERAAADGYVVDHHPTPGAIMQTPYSAHGLGHVAFVEAVDPDGTWHISEMNVLGLDRVDNQTKAPGEAASYSFIHDKL